MTAEMMVSESCAQNPIQPRLRIVSPTLLRFLRATSAFPLLSALVAQHFSANRRFSCIGSHFQHVFMTQHRGVPARVPIPHLAKLHHHRHNLSPIQANLQSLRPRTDNSPQCTGPARFPCTYRASTSSSDSPKRALSSRHSQPQPRSGPSKPQHSIGHFRVPRTNLPPLGSDKGFRLCLISLLRSSAHPPLRLTDREKVFTPYFFSSRRMDDGNG